MSSEHRITRRQAVTAAGAAGAMSLAGPALFRAPPHGRAICVSAVVLSPNGQHLAGVGDDGSLRIWDAVTGRCTASHEAYIGSVEDLAFSPDGRYVTIIGKYETVSIWDVVTGVSRNILATEALVDQDRQLMCAALSRDGRQLAAAGTTRITTGGDRLYRSGRLWNLATGTADARIEDPIDTGDMVFSPDGGRLAMFGYGTLGLWNTATGKRVKTFDPEGAIPHLTALAFSPDSRQLAGATTDRTVLLWDASSGRRTATLRGHTDAVRAIAFAPDGRHLASASANGSIRLWDLHSATAILQLRIAIPITELAWGQSGITVSAATGLVQLALISTRS